MVFDPLSIIGYVGTAAGLIGFMFATVTRLEKFGRDFGEASKRLKEYNRQMTMVSLHLKTWSRLWCEEFHCTDEDYEYLWGAGPEGYSHIQALLEDIRHEIDAIGILMYGSLAGLEDSQLEGHEQVTHHIWDGLQGKLHSMSKARDKFDPGDHWFRNFFSKLRFASYRSANLEERTQRLQKKVENLKTSSQELFTQTQFWLPGSETVDGDAIRQLNQRRERVAEWCEQLRKFHSLSSTLGEWSLVLTLPHEGSGPKLIDEEAGLCIKFAHQPRALTQPGGRSLVFITVSPPIEALAFRSYKESLSRRETAARVLERSNSLHDLFHSPDYQARHPGKRKSLAHAAIGVVNWTMLLWDMPWTVGICSCRLRFVGMQAPDGSRASRASITDSAEACPKNHTHHISDRPALLMGVSLAELVLKQSITVTVDANRGNEATFYLDRSDRPTDEEPQTSQLQATSEEQLLNLIKPRSTRGYKDAVKYCLLYDKALSQRDHEFRPHDVTIIKERVLNPLVNYLNGLEPVSAQRLALHNRNV
ncbi:hypothetical protein NM208_g12572 [Fusarium decemcellulare]|uniref:Uncharacterized protein n=1 Tax=Fusarium decemcellulare TaxID=57161 RepID=A0ACC1RQN9_9HYPO|nr:hypothetical protein NM208_g12572 [Fusarium decemcellulare]